MRAWVIAAVVVALLLGGWWYMDQRHQARSDRNVCRIAGNC